MSTPLSTPICHTCGSTQADRHYHRTDGHHTCEPCLLDARKRLSGLLDDHPYEGFVESLAAALDLRERETGQHSKRVAAHTLILARHHYSAAKDLREIYWGSLLHDIGKIGVPDAILLKPDKLTEAEWVVMQLHPAQGRDILKSIPAFELAAEIVLCHEERFDGSGYPRQLRAEAIPFPARLFAIIDTLDAMTFDRPYRKALPFDTARDEIVRMAGSQFDPAAVDTFLKEETLLREMTTVDHQAAGGVA